MLPGPSHHLSSPFTKAARCEVGSVERGVSPWELGWIGRGKQEAVAFPSLITPRRALRNTCYGP